MVLNGRRIELEIGELVLRGVDPAHRHAVAEALRAELERLLAEPGSLVSITEPAVLDRLSAGSIRMGAGARSEALGMRLAGAVFATLSPPSPASVLDARTPRTGGKEGEG